MDNNFKRMLTIGKRGEYDVLRLCERHHVPVKSVEGWHTYYDFIIDHQTVEVKRQACLRDDKIYVERRQSSGKLGWFDKGIPDYYCFTIDKRFIFIKGVDLQHWVHKHSWITYSDLYGGKVQYIDLYELKDIYVEVYDD